MSNNQNQVSKADVQSSELNKLPVPGQEDTEFSAEEAAEAFENNQSANHSAQNEEQE
ncbi:hypothetical protein [Paenibacillus sacheonensis]|uniref:hypothetical protein n=1 Tax=Paenibacillus sacheonensis TaxID=742054 RepID=UPI001479396D|nr:hypothetical protein [Paenibacillus sacheonensis]MBM7563199.1 hypothetical protein [Paenibacillus sacheonensis]